MTDPKDKAHHDRVVELVEAMLRLHKEKTAAKSDPERELIQRKIDETDGEIEALVYELFGLTEEERQLVEAAN